MSFALTPLAMTVALGPLAVYLVGLGLINLAGRPVVVAGGRDFAALAGGLAGLAMVGPLNLFLPAAAANHFQEQVWLLLAAFYVLSCTLVILVRRPRITIYNVAVDELQPALARTVAELDPRGTASGHCWNLPRFEMEFLLDRFTGLRNVSLVSTGAAFHPVVWRELRQRLAARLAGQRVGLNPWGISFTMFGALLGTLIVLAVLRDPASLWPDLADLLRLSASRN